MSLLYNIQSLSKSFSTKNLFEDLSFSLFAKDHIGLIGLNGCGKSTLLKVLMGFEKADEGTLSPRKNLKIGYVPQTCEFPDTSPLSVLVHALDHESLPDYEKELLANTWLSKAGFSGNEPSAQRLSGGWKKRLSIIKTLITQPELLLLDEPTNHLDLEGILWLEKILSRGDYTYLLVSHDRYFLSHVTNRIIEIDKAYPKGMLAIDGSYAHFLEKKELFLLGQLQQERSIASKARRESEWLKSNPKARTTKSQARIDEAGEILENLSDIQRRNRQKRADIDFVATERETKKLFTAKNLCKEIEGRTLFKKLDLLISPGTRIGLMGPNGSGKTTLLRLIAGEIQPDQGTIKKADDIKIVYFDQHRTKLPDEITLRQALSPSGDYLTFRGQRIHVNGWCKRFLFSPDILDMPLKKLSNGERARISMAHLMTQPADVLLLDEPTNDLDIPTLETLEESLIDFPGAVILITHDRCMMDRICNAIVALGDTEEPKIFADYLQWELSLKPIEVENKPKDKKADSPSPKGKLSYTERKEYDQMEQKVLALEEKVKELQSLLETDEIALNPAKLQAVCEQIGLLENQIEQLYVRWEELDQKLRGNTLPI